MSRLGLTGQGQPVLDLIKARAPVTLWLIACALVAGYALGILWGLFVAARGTAGVAGSVIAVVLVALPVATVAAWLAPAGVSKPWWGAAAMAVSAAALVSRYQRAALQTALAQDYVRTAVAFGAGPWRIRWRAFPAASAAVISLLAADVPAVLTSAFVVEHAFRLPGIGEATLEAVARRDVPWLMAVALGLAFGVALLQIASDALLGALDPRVRLAFARQRGAPE
jgi:peptide/nickel transport system permease protein